MQKKFADMTQQEAFETAVLGVVKQGALSRDDLGCHYRGPNGLKCAVGHLIADEDYSSELEAKTPADAPVMKALGAEGFSETEWLIDLQWHHDRANSLDEFIASCAAFAEHNGLRMPVLAAAE